ncbi:hypothetical protein AB7W67_07835 [Providencia rettgeri]
MSKRVKDRDVPLLSLVDENNQHLYGGNDGGGGMESRVAKLESDVEYIKRDIQEIKSDLKDIKKDAKSDFRMLFGVIITTTLGLAALMAKGFGWL